MVFRWTIVIIIFFILGSFLVNACKKSGEGDSGPHPLSFSLPAGFPAPHYDFSGNPLTEEGFALGRKLFYDGRLSKDGNFPCASCHQQFAAFATFDHPLSHGFDNQFTTRNAPGLFNMVWLTDLHWDGGINNLEVQPLAPITAPNEMAEDLNTVVKKLQQDNDYKRMFRAAFGEETINSQRMLLALTQFVGSMVSADSKYDRMKKAPPPLPWKSRMATTCSRQNAPVAMQSLCLPTIVLEIRALPLTLSILIMAVCALPIKAAIP